MWGHFEGAKLHQSQPAAGAVGRKQLVDAKLRPVRVAGHVHEQVAQDTIDNPGELGAVFRQLRELKEQCEKVLGAPLPQLSMGMSGDFEVAIEEGATLVRIGTLLLGMVLLALSKVSLRRKGGTAGG